MDFPAQFSGVPSAIRTRGLSLSRSMVCHHAVPLQCNLISAFTGFSRIANVILYLRIITDFIPF